MALYFLEAHRQVLNGSICWEEYIDQVLAHCTSDAGHTDDSIESLQRLLRDTNPFAYMIWTWSKREWIQDITPLKAVFTSYAYGSLANLEEKLSAVPEELAADTTGCLAVLALKDSRAKVLKLCFDLGDMAYGDVFADEAARVNESTDPKTFKVLEESAFRQEHPKRPLRDAENDVIMGDAAEGYDSNSAADLDAGGSRLEDCKV